MSANANAMLTIGGSRAVVFATTTSTLNLTIKLVCVFVFLAAWGGDVYPQGPCGGKPCGGDKINGGGESTKKKANAKKKTSGTTSANTTPPRPTASPLPTRMPAPTVQVFGPGLSIDLGNNVKLELVLLPAGTFTMGSPPGEVYRRDDGRFDSEGPQHQVTISHGFYMGKYEVTQAQWQVIMGTTLAQQRDKRNSLYPGQYTSPYTKEGANYPMSYVTWSEAQEFLNRLNALNNGFTYRLPTEAEWEFAARAGTTGPWPTNLDEFHFNNASSGTNHPVGVGQPNPWGLYDMHGNVWEWCQDSIGPYSAGPATDPTGSANRNPKVLRGGGAVPPPRSAQRGHGFSDYDPDRGGARYPHCDDDTGFRVVAVVRTDSQVPTAPNPTMNSTDTQSDSSGKKRLYRFSSNGCVFVEIHVGHVDFCPKEAEIIITPPSPAKAWRDKPGIVQPQGDLPTGNYKICAIDRDAWGVEVWN